MSIETKEYAKKLVSQMTLDEKMSQMLYDSPAIERLGIPEYNWWNEALHGVARAGEATMFPRQSVWRQHLMIKCFRKLVILFQRKEELNLISF